MARITKRDYQQKMYEAFKAHGELVDLMFKGIDEGKLKSGLIYIYSFGNSYHYKQYTEKLIKFEALKKYKVWDFKYTLERMIEESQELREKLVEAGLIK